ncbi:MAG: hypothetical protein GX259_05685 [Bacteroidales bacterium]|nr:hypothetical protein [Bacteroidales bacterium]
MKLNFFGKNPPPKAFFQYVALLAGALVLFGLLSFANIDFKIGPHKFKDIGIKKFFYPEELPVGLMAYVSSKEKTDDKVDSSSQRFLLIGDSMLEFLRIRLNDYCRKNGHSMNTVIWYSSSTLWYGQCDTLKHFIKKHNPSYVLLVLGANELFIRDIKTERAEYVRHIIAQMDTLPFLWIGPPNWKDDTGINDLILHYTGSKRYFPSKDLSYERTKDGAHPKKASAFKWMDSIAVFLQNKAEKKILMSPPDTFFNKIPPTEILQPNAPF